MTVNKPKEPTVAFGRLVLLSVMWCVAAYSGVSAFQTVCGMGTIPGPDANGGWSNHRTVSYYIDLTGVPSNIQASVTSQIQARYSTLNTELHDAGWDITFSQTNNQGVAQSSGVNIEFASDPGHSSAIDVYQYGGTGTPVIHAEMHIPIANANYLPPNQNCAGEACFDYSGGNFGTIVNKIVAHEMGHSFNLADVTGNNYTPGGSVMNPPWGTNDYHGLMGTSMSSGTGCDLSSLTVASGPNGYAFSEGALGGVLCMNDLWSYYSTYYTEEYCTCDGFQGYGHMDYCTGYTEDEICDWLYGECGPPDDDGKFVLRDSAAPRDSAGPQGLGPLALDLSGTDLRFASGDLTFETDRNLPFARQSSGSVAPQWLAMDRNGNGRIDGLRELFSEMTDHDPAVPPGGFASLRALDSLAAGGNADGWLDSYDAAFSALVIWTDSNHDGISQEAELVPVAKIGVRRISLDPKAATDVATKKPYCSAVVMTQAPMVSRNEPNKQVVCTVDLDSLVRR